MRKINVSIYQVEVKLPSGDMTSVDYEVKEMLVGVLLHSSLQLTGQDIYNRMPLADKIKKANAELLLEEDEYKKLQSAVNTIKGFGMNDAEMVRRVIEAETVAVTEVNK